MSGFTPNPGQRRAIEAPLGQPTRVVAGAGTGKTEVISRRFVHLLEQDKTLRPEHFLVLTFSEKAAAEMRARIFRAVTSAKLRYARLDVASAAISTFHSFAARLLTDHSLRVGVDTDLPVLSDVDFQAIVEELKKTFFETGYREAYPTFRPLEQDVYAWEKDEPLNDALAILDQLRNQAVDPEYFRRMVTRGGASSPRHQVLAPLVSWLYRAYLDRLKKGGQLDFDQMIMGAAELLETDAALRESLRRRYRVLLVDEYQDTNHAQARMLTALAAEGLANVTVVGDPRQAIYVWREARVENIARFPAQDKTSDLALTENRRSLKPILDVANRAIAAYDFDAPPEFSAKDVLKPCKENRAFKGQVVSLHAAPTREEEARLIAGHIQQAHAQGYTYRDVAILLRARTYLSAYTEALTALGIPFELSAEDAFYTRPEILDAIHLLQVCVDPAQDLSVARVLLSPVVGLTQAQAAGVKQTRKQHLWRAIANPDGAEGEVAHRLNTLVTFWQRAQQQRWLLSPTAFVSWAIRQSGLEASADDTARRALCKLLALAHAFEAEHPAASARDLVEHLRLVLDGEPREKTPEMNSQADAVQILTAHGSKGLEFPVVIAADSRQKVKAKASSDPFHEPDLGLVFPADDKEQPPVENRTRRSRNEGRCLWYVTLTRAKRRLIITATNAKELESGQYSEAKTFFEELWNLEAATPTPGVQLGGDVPTPKPTTTTPAAPLDEDVSQAAAFAFKAQLEARLKAGKPEFGFSPSAILRYQTCPAAYRYDYVARLSGLPEEPVMAEDAEPRTEGGGGSQMGTVFHAAVAAHAQLAGATADRLLRAVDPAELAKLTAEQRATVRGWLEGYLRSDLGRERPTSNMVERGLTLTLEFDAAKLRMNGKADRLEPGRLVDFKTDVNGEGLAERYGDQLRLYALAARQAGWLGPNAELAIYHAPTGAYLPVPFTEQDETRLREALADFARTLAQPEPGFPPVRSDFCRWCAARETVCETGRRRAELQRAV